MDVREVQATNARAADPQAVVERLQLTVDLVRTMALQARALTHGRPATAAGLVSLTDALGQLLAVAQSLSTRAGQLLKLDLRPAETDLVLGNAARAAKGLLTAATGIHALICRALADAAAVVEEQSDLDAGQVQRVSSRRLAHAAQDLQDAMNQLALSSARDK